MSKRILVVDDHDVVRQGVLLILRARPNWQVVGEASDGMEAVEKVRQLDPDLVILDISMPRRGGLEVLGDLQKLQARAGVLVLSMHESKELATQVRRLGAAGYINKTNAGRDLLRALDAIAGGDTFFPSYVQAPPGATSTPRDKEPGAFRIITEQLIGAGCVAIQTFAAALIHKARSIGSGHSKKIAPIQALIKL
jgi:DNA-binding NarL/FixJ family response regulator